jgi:hypothetical protein
MLILLSVTSGRPIAAPNPRTGFQRKCRKILSHGWLECEWTFWYQLFAAGTSGMRIIPWHYCQSTPHTIPLKNLPVKQLIITDCLSLLLTSFSFLWTVPFKALQSEKRQCQTPVVIVLECYSPCWQIQLPLRTSPCWAWLLRLRYSIACGLVDKKKSCAPKIGKRENVCQFEAGVRFEHGKEARYESRQNWMLIRKFWRKTENPCTNKTTSKLCSNGCSHSENMNQYLKLKLNFLSS